MGPYSHRTCALTRERDARALALSPLCTEERPGEASKKWQVRARMINVLDHPEIPHLENKIQYRGNVEEQVCCNRIDNGEKLRMAQIP